MSQKHQLFKGSQNIIFIIFAILGIISFISSLNGISPQRGWSNFLLNNFYFLSMSLIAVCFLAMHYLTNAGWPVILRRIPEAMTGYLPLGALLMVLFYFGIHSMYHWSHEDAIATDAILQQKSAFLNTTGFMIRLIVILVLWLFLTHLLLKSSRVPSKQQGEVVFVNQNVKRSALFLVVFALSFSLASIDWIMSLEPHWYSTIFPWYTFSSVLASGIAFITMLLVLLKRKGYFQEVNEYHFHELGKYLFAFSFFWGYLWFSQYLLIWYSNIPEETIYYVNRLHEHWQWPFYLNLILNFVLPFCLLLPASTKKNMNFLFIVCLLIILGHWLDFYLMIMPSVMKEHPQFGWTEISIFLGFLSLFLLCFDRSFSKHDLVPKKDPFYEESLHFHGY